MSTKRILHKLVIHKSQTSIKPPAFANGYILIHFLINVNKFLLNHSIIPINKISDFMESLIPSLY